MQAKMEAFTEQKYMERITKSPWASPTVPVLKKDPDGRISTKDIRLAIDYRRPNTHIKQITLMMPDVHARIRALQDYSIFAELDWSTAFHQIPIDKETGLKLAVSTPFGLYAPRFVPEGVSVGSALLMQYVYIIFADFEDWLVAVHDNLLIAATDGEDLLQKTDRVLKRCREYNIQLNIAKSKFGVTSILFFGYRLEKGKYGIESSRINDVRDIPFPKTLVITLCNLIGQ